jgi:putative iron-regulated protein
MVDCRRASPLYDIKVGSLLKWFWVWTAMAGLTVAQVAAVPAHDLERDVVHTYARFLAAAYDDAVAAAQVMERAILDFLSAPTTERLEQARASWKAARGSYLLTEVGRFYGGPIDDSRNLENQINPWPIDESYIESAAGAPVIGLIQSEHDFPRLTPETIARLNARDGERNIACGWHAIEFMLWGVDSRTDGAGERPASDFTTAPQAARRAEFLKSATRLLLDDLETVARAWRTSAGTDTYRGKFEAAAGDSLGHIFTALYQLSGFELASERILVAIYTQAQEDETDCFSDTTSGDFVWGVQAMANMWRGEWVRRDGEKLTGTGLRAFVAAKNAPVAVLLDERFATTLTKCQNLPARFDQAILKADGAPEKEAFRELAEQFEAQADLLAHFAKREGIELDFEHNEEGIAPRGEGGESERGRER